jgi:type IV secretion system protein VirD4
VPSAADSFASSGAADSIDDGGLQQQPELREVTLPPEPERAMDDLALLDDDAIPLSVLTQPDPRLQRAARLAALDPDDGIAL